MVLTSTGFIRFSDVQNEFGGTNPISISEYYRGGANVANTVTGIPSAPGTISMSQFRGKAKPPTKTATVDNYGSNGVAIFGVTFTTIQNVNVDDGCYQITVPFNFNYMGRNYGNNANGGIWIGTNSYITFGQGSSNYSSLGPSNPPLPTIHNEVTSL